MDRAWREMLVGWKSRHDHARPGDHRLEAHVAQIVTLVRPPPPPPPPTRAERIGTWLLIGAVGAAAAGGVAHGIAYYESGRLDDARAAHDPVAWDRTVGSFETARGFAVAGYAVAIGAVVAGVLLRREHPDAVVVTASVGDHAAIFGLAW